MINTRIASRIPSGLPNPLLNTPAFLIAISLLSFQATRAIAADTPSPDSQIASFLKVGMTNAQIEKIISEKRPGEWWDDRGTLGGEIGAAERYALAAAKVWRSFLDAPVLQNVRWDEK